MRRLNIDTKSETGIRQYWWGNVKRNRGYINVYDCWETFNP